MKDVHSVTQASNRGQRTVELSDLAKTIRSKNAGTDKITFDIIFREKENYERVKASKRLTRKTVARLYNIPEERICDFVEFDPAYAIKFTIYRKSPSGGPGERDIFGSQQYAPLLDIEIPVEQDIDFYRTEPNE